VTTDRIQKPKIQISLVNTRKELGSRSEKEYIGVQTTTPRRV